jgi:hypothetical protein
VSRLSNAVHYDRRFFHCSETHVPAQWFGSIVRDRLVTLCSACSRKKLVVGASTHPSRYGLSCGTHDWQILEDTQATEANHDILCCSFRPCIRAGTTHPMVLDKYEQHEALLRDQTMEKHLRGGQSDCF